MCPDGYVFVLVGGEAAYHETHAVGACFVLECSRGRGCREGQEGAGVPLNTKKNTTCCVFFVSWGWWGAGEGREAAEHKECTHMGTFFVFGCRRSALA